MTKQVEPESLGSAQDPQTAIALSARYGPAVKRFFARRLRDNADVEDLTQEVFARLLKRSQLGAIANVEGYLFQIAANLLHERSRRQIARRHRLHQSLSEADLEKVEDFSLERILLAREAYALMVQALQELPERTRTIFILNRFEDMTGVEIAKRLGLSVSAVEKNMMRAIAHLKARLP